MAHEIFRAVSNLRLVLNTETDADSPDNETTYKAIREMIEILFQIMVGTGDDGSLTSNPPNDTTGVATDSAGGYDVDEYNGCTLVFTSGNAKGNFYTIDDTTATTLVCTDDNLYSDGARSGDDYVVLYDIKANLDGHDHDAVNSKAVNLANDSVDSQHYIADSIDTEHYAPASVDQAAIGANAVGTSEIKESSGTVTLSGDGTTNQAVTGGAYCFWGQVYREGGGVTTTVVLCTGYNAGLTAATICGITNASSSSDTFVKFTYITSSGPIYWYFILRRKSDGTIISKSVAPDHVCLGNGGNPALLPHPFVDIYEKNSKLLFDGIANESGVEVEVLVINPTGEQLFEMETFAFDSGKRFDEVLLNNYEISESTIDQIGYPAVPVTVDTLKRKYRHTPKALYDEATNLYLPNKKIIAKPDMVRVAQLNRLA